MHPHQICLIKMQKRLQLLDDGLAQEMIAQISHLTLSKISTLEITMALSELQWASV